MNGKVKNRASICCAKKERKSGEEKKEEKEGGKTINEKRKVLFDIN